MGRDIQCATACKLSCAPSPPPPAFSMGTAGCGRAANYQPDAGRSSQTRTISVGGHTRTYLLHLSPAYDPDEPVAVVLDFHGWGMSSEDEEDWSHMSALADDENFIVAYPHGNEEMAVATTETSTGRGASRPPPASFNAVGCGQRMGPAGQICDTDWVAPIDKCYEDCVAPGLCDEAMDNLVPCVWCACEDSAAFAEAILDDIEANFCVNTYMEFATGESNGGLMTFEVGQKLAHRLAAIVPIEAAPHIGFNFAPEKGPSETHTISIMNIHGTRDTEIPALGAISVSGWWYSPVSEIMKVWAKYNECHGRESDYLVSVDGVRDLDCQRARGRCKVTQPLASVFARAALLTPMALCSSSARRMLSTATGRGRTTLLQTPSAHRSAGSSSRCTRSQACRTRWLGKVAGIIATTAWTTTPTASLTATIRGVRRCPSAERPRPALRSRHVRPPSRSTATHASFRSPTAI